jgi:hypothetical protein
VDVSALEINRTLALLYNSAYAVYQDVDGRTLRSAINADTDSVSRWKITRRAAVPTNTTSPSEAEAQRDVFLNDRKNPIPRVSFVFDKLFGATGERWPNYMGRAGDTITLRNLPPSLSTEIDRIRTFLITETDYDVDHDLLTVTPESPMPRLAVDEGYVGVRGGDVVRGGGVAR